jgi:hypothetical protein
MNGVQIVGAFLTGLIVISAISLIFAPGSTFGSGVSALGQAVSGDIAAAKH